jgi:hypothetical protein
MNNDLALLALGCAGLSGVALGLLLSALDPSLLRWCGRSILWQSVTLAAISAGWLLATLADLAASALAR